MTAPKNLVTDTITIGVTLTRALYKNVILSAKKHLTTIEHFLNDARTVSTKNANVAASFGAKCFVCIFLQITCTSTRNSLYVWTKKTLSNRTFVSKRQYFVIRLAKASASKSHKLVVSLRCRTMLLRRKGFIKIRDVIVRGQNFF